MKYSLLLVALLTTSSLVAKSDQTSENRHNINSLEKEVTSVQYDLKDIDTKVTSVEQRLDSMNSNIDSMNSNLDDINKYKKEQTLSENSNMRISVVGQGVAPMNTSSPAQAYALAKRAATADAYRLIAEKVKGVRIDGQDLIKNMMVKRSTVRTSVNAMVRNANVVETTFKEGLCEVEMEILISHSQFAQ